MTKRSLACGEYFKKLRENSGLSQSQVSRKLGISGTQSISMWERGLRYCPIKYLPIIAKLYDTDVEQLCIAICTAKQLELSDFYGLSKD